MVAAWSYSECGAKVVEVAVICIYEEEAGELKDFCFECGMKALKQKMLKLSEKEVVSGWHFTIPNLREKRHISINYLPELVED